MSANNGASSNGNGSGPGSMAAKFKRLIAENERLAAHYNPECRECTARKNLDTLRAAELIVHSDAAARKQNAARTLIEEAIDRDNTRRAKGARGGYRSKVDARRAQSAKFLSTFDEPRRVAKGEPLIRSLAPLVRRGYLKHRDDGTYVRTTKPYEVHVTGR